MKYVVKFLPVLGFNWWFCEYAFLSRNWSKDETSLRQFINGCKEATYPFLITICPEGNSFSTSSVNYLIQT